MTDDDRRDLNLAEHAPMHLDADVFDGLLAYATGPDAHDVDDSLVPFDSPDGSPADDDLDSIALTDDAPDPLDDGPLPDLPADGAVGFDDGEDGASSSISPEPGADPGHAPAEYGETAGPSIDVPLADPTDAPLNDPSDQGLEW